MILLDTNVISAFIRPEPDQAVMSWLDLQPPESMWTTSISVYELRFGVELLALGRRRQLLEEALTKALEEDFDGRVIPFDVAAAQAAGRIGAARRQLGRTIEIRDVQIAGIAMARKAKLATRNIRHFEGLGLELIDPWGA
ncbi:MAG: toxin FitB [Thermoanaerobaculia bacterium]|nr:toxin FitB [Thermoanaerobaculia bacterium]MEA2415222.1 toxin FitB [Thermoanaerobaculia bacterium]